MNCFILNFVPSTCAACGISLKFDTYASQDYIAGCSHSCNKCGAKFQYVAQDKILSVAEDMKYYVEKEV